MLFALAGIMDFFLKLLMVAILTTLGNTANVDYSGNGLNKALAHGRGSGYHGQAGGVYNPNAYGVYGENYSYKPYNFAYTANSGYGSSHYRQESGQGGVVRGSYGYVDAQGLRRTVNYIADAGGFRAQVSTNEPGVGSASPADVSLHASRPPAGVQERYTFRGHGQYGAGGLGYGAGGAHGPYGVGGAHGSYGVGGAHGSYGPGAAPGYGGHQGQYGVGGLNPAYAGPHAPSTAAHNAAVVAAAAVAANNYNGDKYNGLNKLANSGLANNYSAAQKQNAALAKGLAAANPAVLNSGVYPNAYGGAGRW